MENVVDQIGDLSKGQAGNNDLAGDLVAAYRKIGDEREVERSEQSGVTMQLLQFPRAYKNGESLIGSGQNRHLHIEVAILDLSALLVPIFLPNINRPTKMCKNER